MRVLVTGATGFVGSRLVPALVEAGHDVTTLVRDRDRYDAPEGVGVHVGDLLDPGSFEAALEGVDAAYYLVHSMHAGEDYAERDRRAAHNFAAAASDAGADRVVYLGGLGEERDALSDHLISRREVEHILAEGTYDLTTLRAAIIVGEGSASFRIIRNVAERLPVMVAPRWVRTACQPIAVDDVLAYLVGVLDAPETAGRTFEIGGPDVLTYEEIIRRVSRRLRGRDPIVIPVPVLTPNLSAAWLGLVTDVPRSVARPLVLGLKNPVVVTDDSIDEFVRVEKTDFATAVDRALGDDAIDGGADAGTGTDAGSSTDDGPGVADSQGAEAEATGDGYATGSGDATASGTPGHETAGDATDGDAADGDAADGDETVGSETDGSGGSDAGVDPP